MTQDKQEMKHCYVCKGVFPATEDYFYPSYLETAKERNICKNCHKEELKKRSNIHTQLRQKAIPLEKWNPKKYRTLRSISAKAGVSLSHIEQDIMTKDEYTLYLTTYHNVGEVIAIKHSDAEKYLKNLDITPYKRKVKAIGSSSSCGCCGTTKGNIIAILDREKNPRCYLCHSCYRVGHSYDWEPNRMKKMARLIEIIGIENFKG